MSEKVCLFLTALVIGIGLGYAWRMIQIEPTLTKEFELLQKENVLLRMELREALGKLESCKILRRRTLEQ